MVLCCWCDDPATGLLITTLPGRAAWQDPACRKHGQEYALGDSVYYESPGLISLV